MKNQKIKRMSLLAMLLAIELVLLMTPLGYLRIGPLSLTMMHIPVIIAGIVLGKEAGLILGFVFGLSSMLNATFMPNLTSFVFSPFIQVGGIHGNYASLLIAFLPRMLMGWVAGYAYEHLKINNLKSRALVVGIMATSVNTILVLLGIYFFFAADYRATLNIALNSLHLVLLSVIFSNGLIEMVMAGLISSCLVGVLQVS